jgi:dephospho-CoA kinase
VLSPIVVVTAPREAQIARAVARDGGTREDVIARIAAQLPLEEKMNRAAYVIDNGGSLEATLAASDAVLDAICRVANVDPARYPLAQ